MSTCGGGGVSCLFPADGTGHNRLMSGTKGQFLEDRFQNGFLSRIFDPETVGFPH